MIFTEEAQKGKLALSALLLASIMLISIAGAAPAVPHKFYGSADINGRPVPSGSVITAQVEGAVKGTVVVSQEGQYGDEEAVGDLSLLVSNAQAGQEITFHVQTPQIANSLEASETATFKSGEITNLDLTFSGEEVPKPTGTSDSGGGSSGGGGGSGGSGGAATSSGTQGTQDPQETQELPQEGAVYDLDLDPGESSDLELSTKDSVKVSFGGSDHYIQVKSMSDFSVLLDFQGQTLVLGEGETKELDLNGDYVTDIEVTLEGIRDGKAYMTYSALEKDTVSAGVEGVTGLFSANPLIPSLITLILIGAFGFAAYRFTRRGSA